MKYFLSSVLALVFLGCGTDSQEVEPVSGVHFQGRDCLSCHNVDLGESSHLSIGGTVYRSATSDMDDLFEMCNARVHLQIDDGVSPPYDTRNFNDINASGYFGKSNMFALLNDMPIGTGAYTMRVISDANTTLAESLPLSHSLTTGFDMTNPGDVNNRYSCNACHQAPPNNKNGAAGVVFVQQNLTDCTTP